ncbi:MAG: hypothetical protein OEZ30_06635 [Candidatus Aminicenantes bacterium]|nr:hypothetical protein [Candidatus Aminicenantes bacterium]MDH5715221.1 hypothetical protein [Candidatus Aminicenantes bacterium]
MVKWWDEKGEGALKFIIVLIIIGLAFYLLAKFFPTFWKPYEFKSTLKQEAMSASSRSGYEKELQKRLIEKAQELGLKIDPSNLTIEIMNQRIRIVADYYMEVQTLFGTFNRHFVQKVENPIYQ